MATAPASNAAERTVDTIRARLFILLFLSTGCFLLALGRKHAANLSSKRVE